MDSHTVSLAARLMIPMENKCWILSMKLYRAKIKQGLLSHTTDLALQRSMELQEHLNTGPEVWGHILKREGLL